VLGTQVRAICAILTPGQRFYICRAEDERNIKPRDRSRHDGRFGLPAVSINMHWSMFSATSGVPSCELTPVCVTTQFC
jgi:hypothetical protein